MGNPSVNMDFRRQNDGGCTPCPFSEPGKGDVSNPVYQNPPSVSDSDCFTKNTDALLSGLKLANSGASSDISENVCKNLADLGGGDDIFYVLYYLDKTYCGLGQAHSRGDDPNVNSILTNCSHLGISNLADPGWPSSSYQCTICPPGTGESAQTAAATTSASVAAATGAETTSQGLTTSSKVSSSISLTAAASSAARTTTPFLVSPSSTSNYSSASVDNRIPTQGIAAIVVCTTLAIAAAVVLLFCVLRRRRKQLEAYSNAMCRRASRTTNEHNPTGGDTYEPLISPSHSLSGERPTLTPPLRLSDRKLLPSLLLPLSRSETLVFGTPIDASDHSSSGLYSTTKKPGRAKHDELVPQSPTTIAATALVGGKTSSSFPSSPVCVPTPHKMVPRLERMQTPAQIPVSPEPPSSPPYTRLKSPPPVSFTFPPRTSLDNNTTSNRSPPSPNLAARKGHHRRDTAKQSYSSTSTSVSSGGAGGSSQDCYTVIINTVPGSSFSSSSSPTRPRRPHETPLEIPDLVTPLISASPAPTSPPPNKSLPQPPHPMIGIAKTTGLPPLEGSISLHSLAEQHKRDRDSWGSWGNEEEGTGTVAGKIFGVAFPLRSQGPTLNDRA